MAQTVSAIRLRSWTIILLLIFGLSAAGLRAQRDPAREFIKISDNLYRTRNGAWYGLVYITPDGIVLADPISTDFAGWVKTELDRRFPGVPVRYIIYSHSHWGRQRSIQEVGYRGGAPVL
ncbi:MAG TPA: hypothetical protein VGK48_08250 [Terriglobia bacterium]|jgi:hypothetical protein